MRISFYTLGCKVNQNETGALQQLFTRQGYTLAGPDEEADVYVVNSCTVTAGGDQKSRKWLRRAKRQNPGAVTVLTGCYPQAFPDEAARMTEADVVTGSANRASLPGNIRRAIEYGERVIDITPHTKDEVFEELPMDRMEGHTRAFVKVEDGCNRRCAYCVIPRARGSARSRAVESTLEELRQLSAAGYREVVLSGINLPSYGQDNGASLTELIEKCACVEGIERIRLGSLEPDLLSDEDILRMSRVKELCPQFHMSLQSGCTETLRRMRRTYTAEQYATVADKLTQAFDGKLSFTTDIIVGFPGETKQEFEESMAFIRQIGFLKVHIFPYSRRAGTPAADFENQVPEEEKSRRVHEMQTYADQVRAERIAALEGSEAEVLLETPLSASLFTGYTKLYVPVVISVAGGQPGQIVKARLGRFDDNRCQAEVILP